MTATRKGKGFVPPNYTQTPNTLFDLLPVISNAELRITLALVRETFGWHRQMTEQLSTPELAVLAGLSESSVKTGIAEGMKRGTIKRHKTKDHKKRLTYKYSIVISDAEAMVFEHFERPKAKTPVSPVQDDVEAGLPSQNLTGLNFDWIKFRPGQNLTPFPVNLSSQNLTGSYKEQRNIFRGKKVVEDMDPESASETKSERDDDEGQLLKQINPIPEEKPEQVTGSQGRAQPHDPEGLLPVQEDRVADTDGKSTTARKETVPGAAAAPEWTEAEVNARLHQLLNRRWLNPWRKKGETEFQPPLIDEPDQGHDRHQIARRISPDRLEEIANEARLERNELELKAKKDPHLVVLTHQHLLLRRLTHELIRLEQLDQQVQAFKAPASAAPAPSPRQGPPAAPAPTEEAPRAEFSRYLGLWELKANPNQVVDVVHIEERPGSTPLLHLKTEDTLTVTDITLKYRRPAYAAD